MPLFTKGEHPSFNVRLDGAVWRGRSVAAALFTVMPGQRPLHQGRP